VPACEGHIRGPRRALLVILAAHGRSLELVRAFEVRGPAVLTARGYPSRRPCSSLARSLGERTWPSIPPKQLCTVYLLFVAIENLEQK
jgi:hypothetical protein